MKLVNGLKFGVKIKLSRCDAKIVTSFLLIPAVRFRVCLIVLIVKVVSLYSVSILGVW